MDAIENKIQELKELSKKQKKISEYKKDIADILWNANMDEKAEIAKRMSKIQPTNEDQETNLGFIVPHIVKENYGPKMEVKIHEKPIESAITKQPEIQKEEKISIISTIASKVNVVPWFDIDRPKMEPVEVSTEEKIEPEIKKEEPVYTVAEPELIPEVKQPTIEHIKNEPKIEIIPPVMKKKKKFSLKNFFTSKNKLKKANIVEEIKTTEKNLENIQNEKKLLRQQLREESKNDIEKLSKPTQDILKEGVETGTVKKRDIIEKVDSKEIDICLDVAKKLWIKISI